MRKAQAFLFDILFLGAGLVMAILPLAIGYAIIQNIGNALNSEIGTFVTTAILRFFTSMDWGLAMGFIIFAMMALFLAARYRTSSFFIPLWILMFALFTYVSSVISRLYISYLTNSTLAPILNGFIASKVILTYFPYWFAVIGGLGLVMTYGKPDDLGGPEMGGFM